MKSPLFCRFFGCSVVRLAPASRARLAGSLLQRPAAEHQATAARLDLRGEFGEKGIWGFPKLGVPQMVGFCSGKSHRSEWMIGGYPYFRKPPYGYVCTGWWARAIPLKNDGVRQLGWWDSQYFWENSKNGNQTTNQWQFANWKMAEIVDLAVKNRGDVQ